jgi:hypothetical protein
VKSILAAALLLAQASPAAVFAATAGGGAPVVQEPSLTLYDMPGFRGRSVTLFADNLDLSDTGVVGKARSAQVIGQWRVCEAPGWRGRCQTLNRNIADLAAFDLAGRIVSAALDMGYSRDSYAPDPYAYDIEDYSSPSNLSPPGYDDEGPVPISPYPQMYPFPDYRGGPALEPASPYGDTLNPLTR